MSARQNICRWAVVSMMLVIACNGAFAGRIIYVADDGQADFTTIQAAIDDAVDGDTVIIAPGTYTGDGNRDIDFLGKAITVCSTNPNDPNIIGATIIDCNGTPEEPHRGFDFRNNEGPNSVLTGLTIANGYGSAGGGILVLSSPTIKNCWIINNSASRGGGICCKDSGTTPVISNCRISRNWAGDRGGGIACEDRAGPSVISCFITENSAEAGGGAYFHGRNSKMDHCTVSRNSSPEGEGMHCSGLTISNSIVWGNSGAGGPDIAGTPVISYSIVEGGFNGTTNINTNPMFVSPADNYHLAHGSPCIDTGDPLYAPDNGQTDIDGEPRMMGTHVDIGADEFTDELLQISHRLVFLAKEGNPNPETETIIIENFDPDTVNWQVVEEPSWLSVLPNNGQTPNEIIEVTVSIDISGLEPGLYSCRFKVVPDGDIDHSRTVIVDLHVSRATAMNVPQEHSTIQSAINAAAWGDTILVEPGTYNENINFKGKNINITAAEPNDPDVVATTVIYGDGTASVVTFSGTEESTCSLQGFTIKGGYAAKPVHGGGIQGNGTRARINNCHIIENTAYRKGGGLYDCDGPIIGCIISNNTVQSLATTEGAGLHSCDGPITGCTIAHNTSDSGMYGSGVGGGLYGCDGPITECVIIANHAGGNGGGLYGCDGTITNCTITDNRAEHYMIQSRGGGLFRCDGFISNCSVSDNWAEESGGGLYDCGGLISNCTITLNKAGYFKGGGSSRCESISNCIINGNSAVYGAGLDQCNSIHNCVISNNLAVENGGGLHKCGEIVNCTVTGNEAKSNGGGIYVQGSSTVINCILQNNAALKGKEIFLDTYSVATARVGGYEMPSEALIRYSNVQGGDAEVYLVKDCNVDWAEGNIDAGSLFVDPGYWDPNGAADDPNDDFWVDGDYHLKSQEGRWDPNSKGWIQDDVTSPCIDAGDPNSPIGGEPFPNGGVINIGAYGGTIEASKSYFGGLVFETIITVDINDDGKVDFEDFRLMANHWLQGI